MESPGGIEIFLRFLAVIVKNKRLILVGTFLATCVSIVVVLVTDSVYQSTAVVNPPKSESGAMGSLQNLDPAMGGILGSFLGGGESGLDDCTNILQSTRFAQLMISRFDLETEYAFRKKGKPAKFKQADVIRQFRRMATFETTEEYALRLSMQDTSAVRAATMVSHMIFLLDSLYTDIQKATIRQRLAYVDERLNLAEADMARIEDSLSNFKTRYNLLIPDVQVRLILENATQTELKLETVKEEMALEAALRGASSARYQDLGVQKRLLEKALNRQLEARSDSNTFILPTKVLPELATKYFRLERAYTIRLGVYKYLVQQAEMLKLDADRNIQVISVVDPPWVNDKRVSPKRRVVVQTVFLLSILALSFFVVLREFWRKQKNERPQIGVLLGDLRRGLTRF